VLELPIVLAASETGVEIHGVTRNVCLQGVFFYVDHLPLTSKVAPQIEFKLIFPPQLTRTDSKRALCNGMILRIESLEDRRLGVAATIDKFDFVDATTP
jgi:hypothetical protein